MENKEMQAKIDGWKKQYGDVYLYEVDDKKCYLKPADRKTIAAAAIVGAGDMIKYNEIVLKNCWIDGDVEIQNNDGYFLGISQKLAELIDVKTGELKKL
ncbi:MAG: hypothetical protein RRZ64_07990 [Rikenellaceae bacterium]